jgi:hypothetical protein
MSDDNTQDAAEPSPASAGSVAKGMTSEEVAAALEQSRRRRDAEVRRYEASLEDDCECEHRWIPVSERLPTRGVEVVALWEGVPEFAYRTYDCAWRVRGGAARFAATHWMPLPEADFH